MLIFKTKTHDSRTHDIIIITIKQREHNIIIFKAHYTRNIVFILRLRSAKNNEARKLLA